MSIPLIELRIASCPGAPNYFMLQIGDGQKFHRVGQAVRTRQAARRALRETVARFSECCNLDREAALTSARAAVRGGLRHSHR